MEVSALKNGRFLKVKYYAEPKVRNRIFRVEYESYQVMTTKISLGFGLDGDKYYFVWYVQDDDEIVVQSQ